MEEMKKRFDEYFKGNIDENSYLHINTVYVRNFIQSEIALAVSKERERIVDIINKTEPAPTLEIYLDKVKNGNKDDMYDYGVKITREMIINLINTK